MPVTEIGVNLPNAIGASPAREEIVVKGRPSVFAELVDIANPLQHVPLVSDVYRARTGDTISDGAKFGGHVALGAVAGGPVGALVGAGVFLLEKLFGGGKANSTPHVGLSVRSEDRDIAEALLATGTERGAATTQPRLSSAEFAALIAGFETGRGDRAEAQGGRRDEDFTARMRANLEKLDELKARQ